MAEAGPPEAVALPVEPEPPEVPEVALPPVARAEPSGAVLTAAGSAVAAPVAPVAPELPEAPSRRGRWRCRSNRRRPSRPTWPSPGWRWRRPGWRC